MHGPVLVSWLLAVLTAASGAYCLTRLRHAPCSTDPSPGPSAVPSAVPSSVQPAPHRLLAHESDAAEALMGLGMAAMAVTGAVVPAMVWAWVFGVPAVCFLFGAVRGPARRTHRLHHAIGTLAMTYMALAMAAAPAHAHHAASVGAPLLTGALLLYFGGYSLWTGTRLLGTPGGGRPVGTAGLPQACRLSMGIGMFAMLLTM
ncbi:DUF5134 domain-containing protein [Kitasatospora sp. NPDC088351]|uniref:DUF5134 domain-containing protein n=1 Tax=Kitasatospora sp. NPDC088351 TaxID=3155180 RepID=UPI0034243F69